MRNLAIIIVLFLWALLGWKMCSDYNRCCVAEEVVGAAAAAVAPVAPCEEGAICFDNDSCEPRLGERWEEMRDSLINNLSDNQGLLITGIYNNDESYDGAAQDLGHCRAEEVRALFGGSHQEIIKTAGYVTVGSQVGVVDRYRIETVQMEDESNTLSSPAIGRSAVIYFPYNSTNKLNDSEIEDFLREVARDVKDNGGRVVLEGHTDDKGRAVKNIELGQRRANVIMDYLLGQGLLRNQINAESKGESSPVTTNATAVGRAKNRRVELKIIR